MKKLVFLQLSAVAMCCASAGTQACASASTQESEDFRAARQAVSVVYPLRASSNGRYLVDQAGAPVLIQGDTAWSLFAGLTASEAATYLDDRRARGFNTVLANLIEAKFAPNAPNDRYGNRPFTGTAFQSAANEAYFARADAVISAAAARGIQLLLAPLYLGYDCGDQGWCRQVQAASVTQLREYGRFIGRRYASFANIIWVIGGDTDPAPVRSKVTAFTEGLREFDTVHLTTAHAGPEFGLASAAWPSNPAWLTVDSIYEYSTTLWQNGQTAYSHTPPKPFFHFEAWYENEYDTAQQRLRAQSYHPMLTGGMGAVFGNCPVWNFNTSFGFCDNGSITWQQSLGLQGSVSQTHFGRLFRSRAWHTLVPDQGVFTSGAGSGSSRAVAERASTGETVIAYIPTPRAVTVNMSKIAATTARAWWYDPATGATTLLGNYAASGTRQFPARGNSDSVLVLDDASRSFPAPGTETSSGGGGSGGASGSGGNATGGTTGGTTGGAMAGGSGGSGGAAGVSLGSATVTHTATNEQSYITCGRFAASGTGKLGTMQLYAAPGAGRATMAIYSDVSSRPTALLGSTSELTTTTTGWNSASLRSAVSVTSGANYWLCARVSSSAFGMGYSSGGTLRWSSASYSASWSNPISGMNSTDSEKLAIRAF